MVQGIYYLYFFFLPTRELKQEVFDLSVSVIICAHNEEKNIESNLKYFLEQEHSVFEIVLVNDRSTDKTLTILNELQKKHNNLTIVTIEETPVGWNSKKWALQKGVEQAQYDYLLFSDADCRPISIEWINTMCQGFLDSDLVIGYSPYEKRKGLLNKFIQYETYLSALAILGFGSKGINYGIVGRNFGVKKSVYTSFDWEKIKNIEGGDDDLFLNNVDSKAVAVYSPQTHVLSFPKTDISSYLCQKKRHINISNHYSFQNKFLIGTFNLSQLLFYLIIFGLLLSGEQYLLAIGVYLFRTSVLFFTFVVNSKHLETKLRLIHLLWLDVLYTFFIWIWGPLAITAKKVKWK